MKRFIILLCAIILSIVLIFVISISNHNEKSLEDIEIFENLEFSIKDDSLTTTSATIIIENNTNNIYTTGQGYDIDQYIDGKWRNIKPKEDMTITMEAIEINNEYPLEMNLNWDIWYGSLEPGKYRIVKTIIDIKEPTEKKYIATEFLID